MAAMMPDGIVAIGVFLEVIVFFLCKELVMTSLKYAYTSIENCLKMYIFHTIEDIYYLPKKDLFNLPINKFSFRCILNDFYYAAQCIQ